MVFPVENRKSEHQHCILHIRISLSTKFHWAQTISNFVIKFAQKGYFQSKTKKVNIAIGTKLYFNKAILNFGINLPNKSFFGRKPESQYHYLILHIWISLQSFTKCLRLTLVFMWNSALREKFWFYFSKNFC